MSVIDRFLCIYLTKLTNVITYIFNDIFIIIITVKSLYSEPRSVRRNQRNIFTATIQRRREISTPLKRKTLFNEKN